MAKKTSKIQTNASQNASRVMVQCRTAVNRDAVRRQSIDGVEHIIVSSATLPDNVIMNGGLYPADEIERSFESLELTLAPVEHPHIDGHFISANDPRAIHGFHAGAFNMNVHRKDGRVWVDKFINVAEAMKTDRGKRLLDRIDELENNSDPRPIHTSVGVWVTAEDLPEPMTNEAGDEYSWIARDMVFDHDAILLDSVGAAQPHQGVGVAVNSKGEEVKVNTFEVDPVAPSEKRDFNRLMSLYGNEQSFTDVHRAVMDALDRSAVDADWIEELYEGRAIIWSKEQLFEVPFVLDESGRATIVGIPIPVDRDVTYSPKTNHSEGDAMKELMLKALADAGITVNAEISDAELLAKYNELLANQSEGDDSGAGDDNGIAEVVANAVAQATKPLADKLQSIEANMNSTATAELARLADIVGNSDKYPGLDVEAAKKLGVDTLKSMAANCSTAFGLSPLMNNQSGADEGFKAPSSMPN